MVAVEVEFSCEKVILPVIPLRLKDATRVMEAEIWCERKEKICAEVRGNIIRGVEEVQEGRRGKGRWVKGGANGL